MAIEFWYIKGNYIFYSKIYKKLQIEAQKKYTELVKLLLKESSVNLQNPASTIESNVKGIEISQQGKIFKITLNRPDKFNALTWDMYEAFTAGLEAASKDRNTTITVISGFFLNDNLVKIN